MASGSRSQLMTVDTRERERRNRPAVVCRLLQCALSCIAVIASVGYAAEPFNVTRNGARNSSPSWSPDGSRIAYASNRGGTRAIYVVNANGSSQTNVTPDRVGGHSPAWSPDGTKIVYLSSQQLGGPNDVYVLDMDSGARTNLTRDGGGYSSPSWSPDGGKILFETPWARDTDVFVMDADGGARMNLTRHGGSDRFPSWSPDGLRIAFATNRDAGGLRYEIYVMATDGTNPRRITHDLRWRYSSGISWSPDGREIAYATWTAATEGVAITVMDANGQNPRRLTRLRLARRVLNSGGYEYSKPFLATNSWSPRWSPDGARIAFVSDRNAVFQYSKVGAGYYPDSTDIFVMDAFGDPGVVGVEALGRELTQWGALRRAPAGSASQPEDAR